MALAVVVTKQKIEQIQVWREKKEKKFGTAHNFTQVEKA